MFRPPEARVVDRERGELFLSSHGLFELVDQTEAIGVAVRGQTSADKSVLRPRWQPPGVRRCWRGGRPCRCGARPGGRGGCRRSGRGWGLWPSSAPSYYGWYRATAPSREKLSAIASSCPPSTPRWRFASIARSQPWSTRWPTASLQRTPRRRCERSLRWRSTSGPWGRLTSDGLSDEDAAAVMVGAAQVAAARQGPARTTATS